MGLKHAFTYPFRDRGWWKPVAIGSVLSLLATALPGIYIPNLYVAPFVAGLLCDIMVQGYLIRLLRRIATTGRGSPLPDWRNLNQIFGEGLGAYVIAFIYVLPAFILFILGVRQVFSGLTPARQQIVPDWSGTPQLLNWIITHATSPLPIALFILALVPLAFFGLTAPFIYGEYAWNIRFTAAFDYQRLLALLRSRFRGALAVFGITIALLVASGGLDTLVTFIAGAIDRNGAAIGTPGAIGLVLRNLDPLLFGFYIQLVLYDLYGQIYRKAAGITSEDEEIPEDVTDVRRDGAGETEG